MVIKRGRLDRLTDVFEEIKKFAEEHAYLWDNLDFTPFHQLNFVGGFIAQDECFRIGIKKCEDRFLFRGRNFTYCGEKGLNPRQAAERVEHDFSNLRIECLMEGFYSALEKPLGKYLAKKYLEERGLVFEK